MMSAEEIAAALRDHRQQLRIPGDAFSKQTSKEKYVGLAFAVRGVLYFDGAHEAEVRQAIARCFEAYEEHSRSFLHWLWREEPPSGDDCTAYEKAKPLSKQIASLKPNDHVSFYYTSGEKPHDAGEWQFQVYGLRAWQAKMPSSGPSVLSFSMPADVVISNPIIFEQLFVDFARELKALHGYGGFAFENSLVRESNNEPAEATLVTEFNGIDAGGITSGRKSAKDGFKTISWLTAINKDMLEAVGGLAALRSELPPDWFAFYDYGEGIVIQAGPRAQLAAIVDDPKPPAYVLVNHTLKELRMPSTRGFHSGSVHGEPRMGKAWSNDWLKRFDIDDDKLILVKSALLHEPKLTKETTLPDRL